MDPQTAKEVYQFLLTIAGGCLILLLAIVGYFLNKMFVTVENLQNAVTLLNLTVELIKKDNNNFSVNCGLHHKHLHTTLSNISKRIVEAEAEVEELKIIKGRLKIQRKKTKPKPQDDG